MENKKTPRLLKGTNVPNSIVAVHVFLVKTEKMVYTVEVVLKLLPLLADFRLNELFCLLSKLSFGNENPAAVFQNLI